MNKSEQIQRWKDEEHHAFSGWDFSHLDGRWSEEKLPWDYREQVLKHLRPEHTLLDMGTGGGEFLLALGHPPTRTSVTEGWPPNANLCKERLEPLGVTVRKANGSDTPLPFDSQSFDVIINRHEDYTTGEVWRLLKPGGVFITQQVGGENNLPLREVLAPEDLHRFAGFCLEAEKECFLKQGFYPLFHAESIYPAKFFDVGAVVFYAKAIPWELPGFSVKSHFHTLLKLQEELEETRFIQTQWHRFILVLQKPK